MNSNEVFDAMDNATRGMIATKGMMRRHDAAEVAAGREPASVQMHDALAALLCSCFFHAMDIHSLDAMLRDAEENINRVRSAANAQAMREYEAIAAGSQSALTPFSRRVAYHDGASDAKFFPCPASPAIIGYDRPA